MKLPRWMTQARRDRHAMLVLLQRIEHNTARVADCVVRDARTTALRTAAKYD
jgi:hypothetical protein